MNVCSFEKWIAILVSLGNSDLVYLFKITIDHHKLSYAIRNRLTLI